MFSYDEFKNFVKTDGMARQNRFYIQISMPNLKGQSSLLFQPAGSAHKRDLHLLCKTVSIPGVNVVSAPIRYTGEVFEAPYDRTFGPANLTFFVDRGFYVKKFFDDWIDTIQDPYNRTMGYYNDFISEIKIFAMDRQSKVTFCITLHAAHPKSIGTIDFGQEANEIMTLDITFDYHYYTTELIQGGGTAESSRQPLFAGAINTSAYQNDFNGYQESLNPGGIGVNNNTGLDIGDVYSVGDPSAGRGIKSTATSSLNGAAAGSDYTDPYGP